MEAEQKIAKLQQVVQGLHGKLDSLRQAHDQLLERHQTLHGALAEKTAHIERLQRQLALGQQHMEQLTARQDELTKTLLANNKALSILASSLETMRLESEQGMARRIQALTLPILERLGRDDRLGRLRDELRVVVEELEDLAAGIGDGEGLLSRLTVSERRIAAMIKSGMSSKQIAASLNISLDTVKTHRRNIRRKLRINDAGASLRGFLQARVGRLEDHDE